MGSVDGVLPLVSIDFNMENVLLAQESAMGDNGVARNGELPRIRKTAMMPAQVHLLRSTISF
jgi:hypothetical protein